MPRLYRQAAPLQNKMRPQHRLVTGLPANCAQHLPFSCTIDYNSVRADTVRGNVAQTVAYFTKNVMNARSFILTAAICLLAGPSLACRYNVRDIGFVDLGIDSCILFVLVDNETQPAVVDSLKAIISEKFEETDLRAELVSISDDPAHPAVEVAKAAGITSPPALLFVAPDGRARPVEVPPDPAAFNTTLGPALEALAASPLRQQIAESCAQSYGLILIIEGLDAAQNAAAQDAADAAAKLITEHLGRLPKPIAKGPVTVTLRRGDFQREELLLWWLNLQPDAIRRPHAVVFYGRARQIGPVIKDDEVNENILANVLAIIGADCECSLDRRWMEGPLLPARWPAEARARLAESLGFDPDSPMVKMEVGMILRKGPTSAGRFDVADLGAVPFGYQELAIDFDDPNAAGEQSEPPGTAETLAKPAGAPAKVASRRTNTDQPLAFAIAVAVLTGSGTAVVMFGILVLWRARTRE